MKTTAELVYKCGVVVYLETHLSFANHCTIPLYDRPQAARIDYFRVQEVADEYGLDFNKLSAAFRALVEAPKEHA